MASLPGARTLEKCRSLGWRAFVTERWNSHARRRLDAFGFGDVLVMDDQDGALLVQACITSDMATRAKKIAFECTDDAVNWLSRGNRIQVWGWSKRVHRKKDGTKAKVMRWKLRRFNMTIVHRLGPSIDWEEMGEL